MEEFAIIAAVALAVAAFFIWGIVVGKPRGNRHQRVAFYSGLVGLVAMPIWFLGVAGLMMQFIMLTLDSVPGYLAIASTVLLLGALMGLVYAVVARSRSFD